MRTDKYHLVAAERIKRSPIAECRYMADKERIVVSESDVRTLVQGGYLLPQEAARLEEIPAATARAMIARNEYRTITNQQ